MASFTNNVKSQKRQFNVVNEKESLARKKQNVQLVQLNFVVSHRPIDIKQDSNSDHWNGTQES